ncbi:MAG: hypothetical protein KKB82_02185 [Candidatus Omnitrophica bacterium]|nr:hypothetical protein [Candidatus Omnitrophota bacterium]MBU1924715.1 hypothetical protein [Candidatus Omnitrophota bacterium]
MKYNWPGNIRELENVLQRAVVLVEKEIITPQELPFYIRCVNEDIKVKTDSVDFSKPLLDTVKEITEDVEKQIIIKALNRTNWNRTEAAQLLQVSRKSLFNKMKRFNLLESLESEE